MTLILELTSEEEQGLQQAAAQQGLNPNEYARQLITNHLKTGTTAQAQTPQEWEQSVDAWLKGNQHLPVLSEYAVSRESMYEERE